MADKVSFLKLPVTLDAEALRREVSHLPEAAWEPSYWPLAHGSVDFVLLRGGETQSERDFYWPEPIDHPILSDLPYVAALVGPEGPFGGAFFAFLFRMCSGGVARLHRDAVPVWSDMYRIHIAVETNPGARLVTGDRRAQHFTAGEAWTFDNQDLHGVVNGDTTRTHLILDVPATHPPMAALRERAEVVSGEPVSDADWGRLAWPETS